MRRCCLAATLFAVVSMPIAAQMVPELLYYKFDEGSGASTTNFAVPGVGTNPATIVGHTFSPTGQFNGGLLGVTNAGAQNLVETGWNTALGTGSWTVSFNLNLTGVAGASPFMYVFGDPTAGSFRCFTNGAAGAGNALLRGPLTDVVCAGAGGQAAAVTVTYVYDNAAGNITPYLNGVAQTPVAQGALTVNGTSTLKVGSYNGTGGTASLLSGAVLDEYRLYSRALNAAEVGATWNTELFSVGLFASFSANPLAGPAPLLVNFTDTSFTSEPGGLTGWAWDFDNNGTIDSTAQSPSHTYTVPGTYSVALTVTDGVNPANTRVLNNLITVEPYILTVTTTGVGDLNVSAPPLVQYPGTLEGYTLVSGAVANALGFGPLFGITPDPFTFQIFFYPATPGNPLHFAAVPGLYPDVPYVLGPGAVSSLSGVTLDFVVVYVTSGSIQASNVARTTF